MVGAVAAVRAVSARPNSGCGWVCAEPMVPRLSITAWWRYCRTCHLAIATDFGSLQKFKNAAVCRLPPDVHFTVRVPPSGPGWRRRVGKTPRTTGRAITRQRAHVRLLKAICARVATGRSHRRGRTSDAADLRAGPPAARSRQQRRRPRRSSGWTQAILGRRNDVRRDPFRATARRLALCPRW
jgi:hypothetical protein